MPTKNHEKIISAAVYIDGEPIEGIQEITLPEISVTKITFKDRLQRLIKFAGRLKRLIELDILIFKIRHKRGH